MSTTDKEVIVIGASIAGAYFSYLMVLFGYRCTLLDIETGKNEKACGESLSPIGVRYLNKTGFWDDYLESECKPYYSYNLSFSNGAKAELRNSKPLGYAIERHIIDGALRKAATFNPLTEFINEKVMSVKKEDDFWIVSTSKQEYRTKIVVIASGLSGRSLIPNSCSIGTGEPRYGIFFKSKGNWKDRVPDNVFIKNHEGYQILLNPLNNDTVNLNILCNKERTAQNKSKETFLKEALEFARDCGFTPSNYTECRGSRLINSSYVSCPPEGIYYIGDSAELLDPVGGLGMTHAFFSASLAAEFVADDLENPDRKTSFSKPYYKKRNRYARSLRRLTALAYNLNVKEIRLLIKIASHLPGVTLFIMKSLSNLFPLVGLAKYIYPIKSQPTNFKKFKTESL